MLLAPSVTPFREKRASGAGWGIARSVMGGERTKESNVDVRVG